VSKHLRDGAVTEHFVSTAPFDPYTIEELTTEQERYHMASQRRMMWWRLKRHRLAVVAGAILLVLYLSILVSEILAPYNLHTRHTDLRGDSLVLLFTGSITDSILRI
jgi:peptide/nickel transport system permease protein